MKLFSLSFLPINKALLISLHQSAISQEAGHKRHTIPFSLSKYKMKSTLAMQHYSGVLNYSDFYHYQFY